MRNLLDNPFGGVVYPINPKRRAVQGVLCYPNLAAVPEKVELAVIATPAATVPTLVRAMCRTWRAGRHHHLRRVLGAGCGGPQARRRDSRRRAAAGCVLSARIVWESFIRRATSTPALRRLWPCRTGRPPEPERRYLHRHPRLGASKRTSASAASSASARCSTSISPT